MQREVGVSLSPRGLHQAALSISFLSPILNRPDAFFAKKIASLIFRPDRGFFPVTSFQSFKGPSLSFGSSSLISRRRHFRSLSPVRLRPPGNIHNLSRRLLTRSTRPLFAATSFDDFAISLRIDLRICINLDRLVQRARIRFASVFRPLLADFVENGPERT
jgi:hypothetical protein